MKDKLFQKLEKKLVEVTVVTPQNVGVFTPFYKDAASLLKFAPWRVLIPLSFILSLLAYFFLGSLIVFVVSYLQHGF